MSAPVPPDDRAAVEALIGRPPQGAFDVVVRSSDGGPIVVRNAPFLDDGRPMPTRFYLVGTDLVRATSRLEAAGGVRDAEAIVDPADVAAAHEACRADRDAAIAADHVGHRPTGGVGGTRTGVKCLHAHLAHHLAGGHDAVGIWTAQQLVAAGVTFDDLVPPPPPLTVEVPATTDAVDAVNPQPGGLTVRIDDFSVQVTVTGGSGWSIPVGPVTLLVDTLENVDPPTPAHLTNALGLVHDHFDDIVVASPIVLAAPSVVCAGHHADSLARTEVGRHDVAGLTTVLRTDLDELFRTVVAEPIEERRFNPGLDDGHVATIVPTLCVVLSIVRRLGLDRIDIHVADPQGDS